MKSKKWHDMEEALGIIWNQTEKRRPDGGALRQLLRANVSESVVDDLLGQNLVRREGENLVMTAEGEKTGRDVTRRHRLAERLLADVIEVKGEEIDKTACEVEHIISADVTDAICTLLGHPRVCPHGSPIPPGECCRKAAAQTGAIVVPLQRLPVGEKANVAYIMTASHPSLHKLLSMGVVPGTELVLHQSSPSYVITVGETQIALDAEVAGQIYVRRRT